MNEYYNFVAEELLNIDIERLDFAMFNLTGYGIVDCMSLRLEASKKEIN